MTPEMDISRELLLLATEINTCEVKLDAVRKKIAALNDVSEYTKNDIIDLTKAQTKVKLEFAAAVNLLADSLKPNVPTSGQ